MKRPPNHSSAPALVSIEPRLLTKPQAAAYCGMTPAAFDRHRKAGRFPDYVPNMARFDRRAIDAALDELSKLGNLLAPAQAEPEPEPEEDPHAAYRKRRDARKAAEAAMLDRIEMVTTPGRGGKSKTEYFHRATGRRLPYGPKHPSFRAAYERCEREATESQAAPLMKRASR